MLLEEYGLIGDLESAALVGRNGSIDWLFVEEYDVARRRQIGNFPQAFSHLTLILAARAISTAGAKVKQAAA
jgi:hypothetical protein